MNLQGCHVTVMGLGHFGGGIGAVQFLQKQGALVTVTDLRTAEQLAGSLEQIDTSRLAGLVLGEHREELFTDTDLVIVSPAVQPDNHYVQLAHEAGIPVSSEIALFWGNCPARKLVVTGSTGKSTTATLIYQCLLEAGWSVRLGGNLGGSLLDDLEVLTPDDWVVLELSSFQLQMLSPLQPRPDVAVVTNLFPNHIDWHGSFEAYEEAKQVICAFQSPDDLTIFNADDAVMSLWPTDGKVIWYGKECWRDRPGVVVGDDHLIIRTHEGGWKIEPSDLSPALQSPHGMMNAAAALAAVVVGLDVSIEHVAGPLKNFAGLPHRLQPVGELDGRLFINDSKATTPEATIAALRTQQQPVILIVGGKDKGADLSELAAAIQANVKRVVCIGDTGPALKALIIEKFEQSRAQEKRRQSRDASYLDWISSAASLPEAVKWAWAESDPGDVILLSPACASHSEFAHYEQRGEQFVAEVGRLEE